MWCGRPRIRRRTAGHRTAPRRTTADQPPRQHSTQRSRGTPPHDRPAPAAHSRQGERDSRPAGRGYGVIFMCARTGTGIGHQSHPYNGGYARRRMPHALARDGARVVADGGRRCLIPVSSPLPAHQRKCLPYATQLRRGLAEHRGVPACAWAIASGLHETGAPLSMPRAAVR
jgi:hypothetical protein